MNKSVMCPYCGNVEDVPDTQFEVKCSKCGKVFEFASFELESITLATGRKITLTPKVFETLTNICEYFYEPFKCIYFDKNNLCGIKGCPLLFISNKQWDEIENVE